MSFASGVKKESVSKKKNTLEWRKLSLDKRITHALVNGILDFIVEDVKESFAILKKPLLVIEGPLMEGMKVVGKLFGEGKMFYRK